MAFTQRSQPGALGEVAKFAEGLNSASRATLLRLVAAATSVNLDMHKAADDSGAWACWGGCTCALVCTRMY